MSVNLSGIPAEVRSYVLDLEQKLEASWATKHLVLFGLATFALGVVVTSVL